MKKVFMVLFTTVLFTAFSAAQTGDTSTKSKSGGAGSTITGCLSGPNNEGVYELKSGHHNVEVGGNDELSKHVGHQVKLHGTWEKTGAAIGEKEGTAEKGEKGEKHFKVTSIDHMADSCNAGAAGTSEHHNKKGSGSTTPKL
jgi:hypothetical protein